MIASFSGKLEIVKPLIDIGCDVNLKDKQGKTALMMDSPTGNVDVLNILVEHGADINAINVEGLNALMIAKSTGSSQDR